MADKGEFEHIRTIAEELVAEGAARNAMFEEVQKIFEMQWDRRPETSHIREVVSPGGHNVIRGMVNIMSSCRPRFNVPCNEGDSTDEARRDLVERAVRVMFERVNDARGENLFGQWALSGALFDMMVGKMVRTRDHARMLQKHADRRGRKGDKKRLDRQIADYYELAETHPFLVDPVTPSSVFIRRGPMGIEYLVEKRRRPVHAIRQEFGETACPQHKLTDSIWYMEYWDRYQYCKWVESDDEPFVLDEYDYPSFIPYIVHEVNGTELFGRTALFPILYPLYKGELWESANVALTMWRSNLFALGNPTLIAVGKSAHEAEIPKHLAGGRVNLEHGDSIGQLQLNLVPNDLREFYNAVRILEEESTINKMVFGKPPENILAYSTVNLLVQGARHSIVALQEAMSRMGTEMARKMLRWIKESGESERLYGDRYTITLTPDDINAQTLLIQAEFRPEIPQDRLQLANMAKMLVDSGILSKHSARSLSGSAQPDEEEDLIVREQIRQLFTNMKLQELRQAMAVEPTPPPPQSEPSVTDFIPPPMEEGQEFPTPTPGRIGSKPGLLVPLVQLTGSPPEEFQEAASENMSPIGGRPARS